MQWRDVFTAERDRVVSRAQLLRHGATASSIAQAVKSGEIIRSRRGNYVLPTETQFVQHAVRVGGRLACISALADARVFAFEHAFAHVHLEPNASRLRNPRDRWDPLGMHNRDGVQLHWRPLRFDGARQSHSVNVADALVQSLWCQRPVHSLASIDNAVHTRLISVSDVPAIFAAGPREHTWMEAEVEPRTESGQETVLRMLLRELDLQFDVQVTFPGIGRVDFVVEGRLALEADSRLAHDGWEMHVRDRERDLKLGIRGLMSLRPAYGMIMYHPEMVKSAIMGLLAAAIPPPL